MFSLRLPLDAARLISAASSPSFSTSAVLHAGYKLKSHSGAKKRFKSLSNGLFKRGQAGHRHLNVSKRPGRKNDLGATVYTHGAQTSKMHKLLPYGS